MKILLPIWQTLRRRRGFTPKEIRRRRCLTVAYGNLSLAGFTIIELLVASAILVILFGSITAVFLAANRSWTQSEARLQIYQNARGALDRMSRELTCAFQPSDPAMQKFDWDTAPDPDELHFTATYNFSPESGEYDLCHLGYRRDNSNNEIERYKEDYGNPGGSWMPMAEHITSLSFEYYDGPSSSWVLTWDDTAKDYLPKAVKITIQAQDKQQRYSPKTFQNVVYLPASQ